MEVTASYTSQEVTTSIVHHPKPYTFGRVRFGVMDNASLVLKLLFH